MEMFSVQQNEFYNNFHNLSKKTGSLVGHDIPGTSNLANNSCKNLSDTTSRCFTFKNFRPLCEAVTTMK